MKTIIVNGRTYKPVDEAGDDFTEVSETLRGVADSLEEADYSEESRLEAIKSLMPLVGKMRAGISVNEEGEDLDEEEFDEVTDEENPEDLEEYGDTDEEGEDITVEFKGIGPVKKANSVISPIKDLLRAKKWKLKIPVVNKDNTVSLSSDLYDKLTELGIIDNNTIIYTELMDTISDLYRTDEEGEETDENIMVINGVKYSKVVDEKSCKKSPVRKKK